MQWPIIPIKNLTSLFPLIFLSKHICVYALGRIKWILGIIWPWNQHFNLKNQRNWKKQVWMWIFLSGVNCILMHCTKKETYFSCAYKVTYNKLQAVSLMWSHFTRLSISSRFQNGSRPTKSVKRSLSFSTNSYLSKLNRK